MDDKARVEGGLGLVYKRGGTFYARVRIAPNKYAYRSLKTGNKAAAIKAAQKLVHKIEFQKEHELPIQIKKFADVINEYVAFREKQHEQGHTSVYMLRQIQRVSKFWIEYAGKRSLIARYSGVLARGRCAAFSRQQLPRRSNIKSSKFFCYSSFSLHEQLFTQF